MITLARLLFLYFIHIWITRKWGLLNTILRNSNSCNNMPVYYLAKYNLFNNTILSVLRSKYIYTDSHLPISIEVYIYIYISKQKIYQYITIWHIYIHNFRRNINIKAIVIISSKSYCKIDNSKLTLTLIHFKIATCHVCVRVRYGDIVPQPHASVTQYPPYVAMT